MTWHATYPIITWNWDSCGGARCRGVLSGKEIPRTALTMSAYHGPAQSKPPIWGTGPLSQNRQYGEVVPAMDCDAISVEYGVESECVGHIYRRGAFQRTWGPAGPSLPDCVSHGSMRGSFMIEQLYFTNRACSEARWSAICSRYSGAGSGSSPDRQAPSPSGNMHRMPDDGPPARKAARAVTSAAQDKLSPVGSTAAVSVTQYNALPAPVMCPLRQRPSPVPRFATQDVAPDTARSISVTTQLYPLLSWFRSSNPCFDLADFDSECSCAAMSSSPVSKVVSVAPVDLLKCPSETRWFVPHSPQFSVSAEDVDRGVVESPELS